MVSTLTTESAQSGFFKSSCSEKQGKNLSHIDVQLNSLCKTSAHHLKYLWALLNQSCHLPLKLDITHNRTCTFAKHRSRTIFNNCVAPSWVMKKYPKKFLYKLQRLFTIQNCSNHKSLVQMIDSFISF